jgi:hypothetical protein
MIERYTYDLPAVPDPTYELINPQHEKDIFERALDEPDDIPENLRLMFEGVVEAKKTKTPIEYDHGIERYFEHSGAQEFIDKWTVYDDDGRLNMDLTSIKIGIPYNFNMDSFIAQGEIVGLHVSGDTSQPIEIHLDSERQLYQATYGHEIGHYFLRAIKGFNERGWNRNEENFCDYFGRRMAMPLEQLDEYVSGEKKVDGQAILDLMSRFRMELGDTIWGLMEYGLLPPRVAIDSYNGKYPNEDYSQKVNRGVFCLHCMQVGGDYNCPSVDIPTPLFDFTDRAWGAKMQSCLGEDLHKADVLSTLTKFYVANEVQLVLFRPGASYEYDSDSTDD